MSEWHLLLWPPWAPQQPLVQLPTLQTQPALLAAYHHILTHPPLVNTTLANLSQHKVAMALLSLTQNSPHWETPNPLYSSSAPCPPCITSIPNVSDTSWGKSTPYFAVSRSLTKYSA